MAEQGYVLDIDTKFLNNLKIADAALSKSITHSKALTAEFNRMVDRTGPYARQLSAIQAAFSKLGSGVKIDTSQGITKLSTEAVTATDKINLLTTNMQQLIARFKDLKSQSTLGMFVNTKEDISNVSALTQGLREAREMLKTEKLTLIETRDVSNQVALYKDAIKELTKSDKQRTDDVVKEVRNRIKQSEQEAKAVRKNMEAYYIKTPNRAISFANQAKSLEELKRAYQYLEKARNKINPDTKNGRKQIEDLNKAMNDTKNKIANISRGNTDLKNSFSRLSGAAGAFGSKIKAIFGLAAIKNFTKKLTSIHGEFEMINKSLEILLHSSARAEATWDRITKLAVKSPFEIKELATATKQMAAYRIESDQLYEKTKMLADISAGLGVKIDRLILAYGQVKAANFLRGTELRQFSEAGIDMLGQLATYFSELEGRAISAAEVFERISKRMVLFEDVDAVLTRITSKGGTFYKMQEEQAKTLRGQLRNLKDEVSLMFHDIGEQNHGILTTVVSLMRSVIKNWRIWVPVIASAVSGFMTFKTVMVILTTATKAWTIAKYAASVAMSLFTKKAIVANAAVKRLSRSMNANPWMLVASAILTVVMALGSLLMSLSRTKKATESDFSSIADIFIEEREAIEEITDSIIAYTKELKELGYSEEEQIVNNAELAAIYNARASAISELTAINSEYAASLIDVLNNEKALKEFRDGKKQQLGAKIEIANVFGEEQDLMSTVAGYAAPKIVGLPLSNKLDKIWPELSSKIPPEYRDALYNAINEGRYDDAVGIAEKIQDYYRDTFAKLSGREALVDWNIDTGDGLVANVFDKVANKTVDRTVEATINRVLGDQKAYDKLAEERFGSWDKTLVSIVDIGNTVVDYVDATIAELAAGTAGTMAEHVVGGMAHDWFGTEYWALSPDEYPQIITDLVSANNKIDGFNDVISEAKDKYLEQYGLTEEYLAEIRAAGESVSATPEEKEAWTRERKKVMDTFTDVFNEYDELESGDRQILEEAIGEAFGFDWSESIQFKPWQERYNSWWDKTIKDINAINGTAAEKLKANLPRIRRDSQLAKNEIEAHENYIKELKEDISRYEQAVALGVPEAYKLKDDADMAKLILPYAQSLFNFYGPDEKSKSTKDTKYKDILKAVDSIHKAYKTLEKDFDSASARTGAWDKYGASLDTALKKIGKTREQFMAQFGDLTSEDSVTQALEWLATQAKDLDEKFDIQQHLGEWTWTLNLEVEKEEFNNAVKAIDEMFAGYELSMELDKLHVPKDFAKDLFDADPISLEDLRKNLYDEQSKFDGTDNVKEFEKYLKKLDELETKSQQERLKKYLEYSQAIIGDRAKILLDSFYELEDIEKTFVMTNSLALNKGLINEGTKMAMEMQGKNMQDLLAMSDEDLASSWGFTQEQIDRLREFNAELYAQRDLAIEASNRKTQSDLNAMDWKALKESDTFILAMQDLERVSDKALDKMISQIMAYKSEWMDMPYSEVKEMIGYLDKLEEARMAYYSPDEMISAARAEMNDLKFSGTADAQTKMLTAEERIAELTVELSLVEEIERLRSQKVEGEALVAELRQRGVTDEETISRLLSAESKDIKSQINDERKTTSEAQRYLKLQTKILDAYKEKEKRIKDIKGLVDKVFDGWDAVNELLEDGSLSSEIAGLAKGTSNAVFEALALVQGFKAAKEGLEAGGTEAEIFGYKLNMAMGIIGWIVMAIQLIAKGLKFAFDQHDKVLQEQIDAQAEKVERLKREYESLEKSIENAYRAADIGRYTREANRNLEEQIAATERMIALEEDKKKTDEEKIRGWDDEIADLREQVEDNLEEAFSTLTGGVIDDVVSTTRDFVDAWHDAFQETGDGMSGLQESFKEMLANMLKQQAAITLITPYMKRFKSELEKYVNASDTELSRMEAEALRETWDKMAPEMNEALSTYFEMFEDILDVDTGSLSGLEKGIQGMTEDQAEVLASYWNSCRFILSNMDNTLTALAANVIGGSNSKNPIVDAIQAQTEVVKEIRDYLQDVIGVGGNSPHGRSYIRVYDA